MILKMWIDIASNQNIGGVLFKIKEAKLYENKS